MRNSDDAKLIARAIKEGCQIIAGAIERHGRQTVHGTTYQIPERVNDQILFRNSFATNSSDNMQTGTGDDLTGDNIAE